MKVLSLFFVQLLVVLCISDDYDDNDELLTCEERFTEIRLKLHFKRDNDNLYLLNGNNNDDAINLSKEFTEIAHRLGFINKVINIGEFCPDDDVRATEIAAKYFGRNVINLRVTNAHYYSDEEIKDKGLIIAGYSGQFDAEVAVCHGDSNIGPNRNFSDDITTESKDTMIEYSRLCEIGKEKLTAVKLISDSIETYGVLYEIIKVLSLDYDPKTKPYWEQLVKRSKDDDKKPIAMFNVLVCLNGVKFTDDIKHEINKESTWITIRYIKNCERIDDYAENIILVALIPKPLELEDNTNIPVIFYDASHILPEHKDIYPNSMLIQPNYYATLKYALMRYIENRNWNRIVIVSDDSPYSDVFESEFSTLLTQKGFPYRIERCMENVCNFTEALISVRESKAKVIIANVDEKYAMELVKTAVSTKVTSQQGYMWIWREWPFPDNHDAGMMGDVFSVYLGEDDYQNNQLFNTMKGISVISNYIKDLDFNILQGLQENRKKSYRKIAEDLQQALEKHPIAARITKIPALGKSFDICTFTANVSHIIDENLVLERYTKVNLPFGVDACTIRSYKFNAPCDDIYVLIEMLIIFTFIVTGAAIYTFFYKYSRRRNNYTTM